jgi:hypothetical protein
LFEPGEGPTKEDQGTEHLIEPDALVTGGPAFLRAKGTWHGLFE